MSQQKSDVIMGFGFVFSNKRLQTKCDIQFGYITHRFDNEYFVGKFVFERIQMIAIAEIISRQSIVRNIGKMFQQHVLLKEMIEFPYSRK